jgi:hypothetical protein
MILQRIMIVRSLPIYHGYSNSLIGSRNHVQCILSLHKGMCSVQKRYLVHLTRDVLGHYSSMERVGPPETQGPEYATSIS